MSAIDVIRTFAESRSGGDEVVRDGITYGVCRQLHDEIARLRQALRAACRDLAEQGVECPYVLFGTCERGYSDGCNEGEDAETEDCLAAMYIRQAPGGAEGEG